MPVEAREGLLMFDGTHNGRCSYTQPSAKTLNVCGGNQQK